MKKLITMQSRLSQTLATWADRGRQTKRFDKANASAAVLVELLGKAGVFKGVHLCFRSDVLSPANRFIWQLPAKRVLALHGLVFAKAAPVAEPEAPSEDEVAAAA